MLSETVEKVFRKQTEVMQEQRREFERRMAGQKAQEDQRNIERREDAKQQVQQFNQRMIEQRSEFRCRLAEDRIEARSQKRWMVGTVIIVGIALAGYMSAYMSVLIHYTH